jgi:hypothetical protein
MTLVGDILLEMRKLSGWTKNCFKNSKKIKNNYADGAVEKKKT